MKRNKSLLLVDDEENLVLSIKRLFIDEDINIEWARNGKEGLKKLVENQPELVVCDYKMPEMDGLEFLRAAKSISAETPIIILTAYHQESLAEEFIKEGAKQYIEKPFKIN